MFKKPNVLKGITAVTLAITLLLSTALVTMPSAESEEASTPVRFALDFESEYTYSDGSAYYSTSADNWVYGNNTKRKSHSEFAEEENGNTAIRLTYDATSTATDNYGDNPVMNIFDPNTRSKFLGTEGTTYRITFDYKIEAADDFGSQLFIAPSNRCLASTNNDDAFWDTDAGPKAVIVKNTTEFTPVTEVITAPTSGYTTVSVEYTAQGQVNECDVYPIIIFQTNGKADAAYDTEDFTLASVLIDNIYVDEIVVYESETALDFEETYLDSTDAKYYASSSHINKTSGSRGSHAEIISEADENKAMRLTYDTDKDENYKANAAFNIYNSATKTLFKGEADKNYLINFEYKIECTDNKTVQLYLVTCARDTLNGTDFNFNSAALKTESFQVIPFTEALTETTDGYVKASASFTADGSTYPVICLSTNGTVKDETHDGSRPYASVLIDNVSVYENRLVDITARNYYGDTDATLSIYMGTTFAELEAPTRKGYVFEGFYTDAAMTKKAIDTDLVTNYNMIYVKWIGDGNAVVPMPIEDVLYFSDVKAFANCTVNKNNPLGDISYTLKAQSAQIGASNVSKWGGEYLFSSDTVTVNDDTTKKLVVDSISLSTPCHSIMLYVELSDFAAAGKDYGLSLGSKGICLPTPKDDGGTSWNWVTAKADGSSAFYYNDKGEWKTSYFSESGAFTGLPSGYKGYIRIDFEQLTGKIDVTTADYTLSCIELSPVVFGGESGDLAIGGIIYVPETRTDSPIWKLQNVLDSSAGTYNNLYFDMTSASDAMVVNSYDVYSEDYSFSTRYSGTTAEPAVKLTDKETSAFWATAPVAITTASGMQETTSGYMTTYINSDTSITLQPGVDTFMFYVELPEFTEGTINAPLKLLDTVLYQTGTTVNLSFSNSAYEYASVYDGIWQSARAGADGDLKDIPSGFKGFIKFCVKDFKNFNDISYYNADGNLTGIDMSKPYSISKFELGFNHIGGENGELVIGGVYSVVVNSEVPFVKNGINGERFCFKAIPGDYDADANFSAEEIVNIRKNLIGNAPEFDAVAKLRAENNDITTLVAATLGMADTSNEGTEPVYPEIFSADIGTTDGAVVYKKVYTDPANYQVIAQDYEAYQTKGDAFAAEVLANQIGTFEKTGIDKMCHVSTFYYSHGNIYMSYYANSISASENPAYQVARLAYAPEDNPENKVIIDIMQVGDDLYGNKITAVYDTILMPKEDEPDNLYILWTAAVNGEYYRLYQVFNMETEELGPIGVNRFKVGDTVNDFSRAGMKKALNNEGIGYKTFASDIGIMQKLSTRVENGETYYYTGAYCCDFTCIIKSKDLITWEYVAQPNEGANGTGFENCTRWENAVYVVGDKVYYYVRQWDPLNVTSNGSTPTSTTNRTENGSYYGILTAYDLITGEWETPILVEDCQSRSDFIMYQGNLYLIYAPTPDSGESDRQHLGILKINTEDLSKTEVVLQAKMGTSCFYPFWQYNSDGELCISYTYSREEIRLASITLSDYLD